MNDPVYRAKDIRDLRSELEGCRAEDRFNDRASLYGIAIGAAGIVVGCAMDYFGGPEYYALGDNLIKFGLFGTLGSVCYWGEITTDTAEEMEYLERQIVRHRPQSS